MRRRFLDGQARPLVLGHRGASADWPENTLLSFQGAMEQGADGVELDVMRCGSGEVVVVHDDDLRRVAGGAPGSEAPVRQTGLEALRRHDLGHGQRVPLLAEVLEALGPEALVNVELKSPETKTAAGYMRLLRDDGLAAATVEVLRRAGRLAPEAAGRTLVSSFDPLQLGRFRRAGEGRVPMGLLFHAEQGLPLREGWLAGPLCVAAVHPEATLVDAVAVRRWHRAGLAVHVWTVDDPRVVAALCAVEVDGLITNRPGDVLAQL